ncbi:MAG TPA: nucleoside hydrolase [Anaerolineales bacterium]|nr:nucleoside hydrolase [Anaerolineales bacterium]
MRYVILVGILLLISCQPMPTPIAIPSAAPKPVIFDGDMAHEDMFAALFLLQHPHVDLKALTVVGTGEAHCAPGMENLRGIVALAGRTGIPVTCGRDMPLAGDHVFPNEWRQRADEVYGVPLPSGVGGETALSAPDLIIQVLQEAPEPVTIIATGPLTNIAEVVQTRPDLIPKIAGIFVMGGAVDVPGNIAVTGVGIANEVAEWNIYIDPLSVNVVLASGAPVILIPLDATNYVPITRRFYDTLGNWQDTPAAQFVYQVLTADMDFVESGGFQFWDSFTAAVAMDESLAKFEMREIVVTEEEGPESGWTRPTPGGYSVRVAVWGDAERYEALLLTVLNRSEP